MDCPLVNSFQPQWAMVFNVGKAEPNIDKKGGPCLGQDGMLVWFGVRKLPNVESLVAAHILFVLKVPGSVTATAGSPGAGLATLQSWRDDISLIT